MNNDSSKQKVKVEVIDAELIEPDEGGSTRARHDVVNIPLRAADTLDAFADTLQAFTPQRAEDMRKKAATVRTIAKSAERTLEAGGGLVASIASFKDKLAEKGLNVGFIQPRGAGRRAR